MWLTWCRKGELLSLLEPWQMTSVFTKSQHWKLQPWGSLRPQGPELRRQVVSVWHLTSLPWGLLLARTRYDYKPHLSLTLVMFTQGYWMSFIHAHILFTSSDLALFSFCFWRFFFVDRRTLVRLWNTSVLLLVCLTATRNRTWGQREGSLREPEERETAGDTEFNLFNPFCERKKIHVLLDLKKYYYVRLYHVLVQVFLLIKTKIGFGERYCFKTLQFPPLNYLHLIVLLLITY